MALAHELRALNEYRPTTMHGWTLHDATSYT